MASRIVLQQQNRGEAVPGAVKQKKNMAPEGRNRKALGDIGNVATGRGVEGKKPLPQKPVAVKVKGANVAKVPAVRKPAQKKATVKPNPEDIIEISPDTQEKLKEKMQRKKADKDLLKQKATLTSTLTARSKAACGLSKKPKEQIVDIDAADVNNELAGVEYVEDIYSFYKLAENETRVHDYMDSQPEINDRMRAVLIDWLVEVHQKFELNPETLYLTINIVDRYLAVKSTSRRDLQLVGISAMLIASKYEEIWAPEVNDFVCISDKSYTHDQVLAMEKEILGQLEWYLTVPTPYVFLARFIKASLPDSEIENMVYFLAELGLMNYATIIYCPSMIAASAVYAARHTINRTPFWNETLKLHTGFSESQLIECARLLVSYHSAAATHKLKVIYKKYSSPERGVVSLLTPAKSLLAAASSSSVSSGRRDLGKSTEAAATSSSPMVVVGCQRCHMYVMVTEADPRCPQCKSATTRKMT
ncbi:PREDICTED: G2/mitotic-specific cyclin S13-7-like [Nicotiana attenuata]|uniref:G2mitotic-specific cyclin s13-6 n=1 Tax=Nicotiana attenuata TaxID=49451 RepID=A0A314L9T4_NICAT|nr:PREDICTED: G2/mitotic-specific cyclin S13-7-like [Nicotiana attenuata]OIT38355.1 g2mitotic-specific cyclin s13-6 [Nicotiana attenuata]